VTTAGGLRLTGALTPKRVWAGLVVALMGFSLVLSLVDRHLANEVAPLGVMFGNATAGWLILRAARAHSDRERVAWRLVGSGLLLGAFGVLSVALWSIIRPPAPAFGPTDVIFVGAYAVLILGIAVLPQIGGTAASRWKVLFDGFIGSVSTATLVAVVFLPGLSSHIDQADAWERFSAFAYPLLDVMAVVIAFVVTIRRSSHRFDYRLLALGAGLALQAGGDLSLLDGLGRTFEEAQPNFVLFLLASGCFVIAGFLVDHRPRPREYAERKPPLWPMAAPYAVLSALLLYIGYQVIDAELGRRSLVLLLIGMAVVGLVVVRQGLALSEYRHLVQQRRDGLVASVSHELRTPLTALVGFLDILRDPEAPVTAEEKIEMVELGHEQAMHMSRIVSDLLLLARDSPRLDLQEEEVTIAGLVEGTVRSLRTLPMSINMEIGSGLSGYVDPVRIRQVLTNLIKNAARYGRGKVLVVAEVVGADLVVEVHDDGAGVPVRFENIIWEQFERGPNRLNSRIPGSGLGLAVVDLMVRRHGGAAGYQRSRRLGGACFRVVLPGRARVTGGARALGLPVPTTVL